MKKLIKDIIYGWTGLLFYKLDILNKESEDWYHYKSQFCNNSCPLYKEGFIMDICSRKKTTTMKKVIESGELKGEEIEVEVSGCGCGTMAKKFSESPCPMGKF